MQLDRKAYYGKIGAVSEANPKTIGGIQDGRSKLITYAMCQYHIVFIPKYRRKVMYGKVRGDVREIIKALCCYKKVEIKEGAVCVDHMHLCVSIPPKLAISEFMGYLKGCSFLK